MKRWLGVGVAALTSLWIAAVPAQASVAGAWNLFYQAHVTGFFSDVAAVSGSDAWAVGILYRGQGGLYQPFLRHWDGLSWKAVTIPGARGFASQYVAASSAKNVWVLGPTPTAGVVTKAYRFDGSHWHSVPVPAFTYLSNPVVFSPTNVWAAGVGPNETNVFHWNGVKWTGYSLNLFPGELSGTWAKNVWVVGDSWPGDRMAAYRWNGIRWLSVKMPHPVTVATPDIGVFSMSDVWIVGYTRTTSVILHWDGRAWRQLPAPIGGGANIVSDGHGGVWFGPYVHWTGHAWIGPIEFVPLSAGGGTGPMARVPGTSSYWCAAGIANLGSTVQEPTIYLYGPVP